MYHLFWGIFFVLLDIELKLGTAVFELLPDFLGYFLMMKGMERLADRCGRFDRCRHWAFGMILLSAVLYGADLFDPETMTKVWFWGLGLAELAAMLLLLGQVNRGLSELEDSRRWSRVSFLLPVAAVMLVLAHLLSWVPIAGKVCQAAALLTGLCYLAALWRAMGSGK